MCIRDRCKAAKQDSKNAKNSSSTKLQSGILYGIATKKLLHMGCLLYTSQGCQGRDDALAGWADPGDRHCADPDGRGNVPKAICQPGTTTRCV